MTNEFNSGYGSKVELNTNELEVITSKLITECEKYKKLINLHSSSKFIKPNEEDKAKYADLVREKYCEIIASTIIEYHISKKNSATIINNLKKEGYITADHEESVDNYLKAKQNIET